MKKYGWEWKTEEGLKSWQEILFSMVGAGGTIGNDLWKFVNLADQLIQYENCFPDSFLILTQLGDIYSMAGLFTAKDISLSNDLIMKAHKASELASKYVVNDQLQDPESVDNVVNNLNLSNYYTTFCRFGITKYLQTDCKEIRYLEEIKPYYGKAISLSPEDELLKFIAGQIKKETSSSTGELANRPFDYYDEFLRQGALALFGSKNYRAASAAFQQAIAMRPQEAFPRIRLSWVEMNTEGKKYDDIIRILKDLDYADSLLQNATSEVTGDENKERSELQYLRGLCHYFLDENDKAAIYLQESLKINPKMDLADRLLRKILDNRNLEGPTSKPQKSGGCFIATVVYGSSQSPEVTVLREFRDEVLLNSHFGRQVVDIYYSFSPFVADFLRHRMILKNIVKVIFLKPVVRTVRIYKKICNHFERE